MRPRDVQLAEPALRGGWLVRLLLLLVGFALFSSALWFASAQAAPASSRVPGAAVAPPPVPSAANAMSMPPAGWRIVRVEPGDLLERGLSLQGGDAASSPPALVPGGILPAGSRLQSTREEALVSLEFHDPDRGLLAHHALRGPFQATLAGDGALELSDGSLWTRLFRYLEQLGGGLTITYDHTPAGFGSTEVAYAVEPGWLGSSRELLVLEGKVTYFRGKQQALLQAGQRARWSHRPGRARDASLEQRAEWVARGTTYELARLEDQAAQRGLPESMCARESAALRTATLASEACFVSPATRNAALTEARSALAGTMMPAHWKQLGDAYQAAGDLLQATDSYRRGLEQAPAAEVRARLQLELGNVAWAQGRVADARSSYEQAVSSDGSLGGAWNNLGVLRWQGGDLEDARAALQKAVALAPDQIEGWRNLGRVWRDVDPARAAQAWSRACGLQPGDAALWRDLSLAYEAAGAQREALDAALESVGIAPDQADLWDEIGKWYWEQGRQAESIKAYERALDLRLKSGGP